MSPHYAPPLPGECCPGPPADDLAAWLTQIWDERAKLAKDAQEEAPSLPWEAEKVYDGVYAIELGPSEHPDTDSYDVGNETRMPREIACHIAANDPASVLARIASERQILADYADHVATYRDEPTPFGEGQRFGLLLALARLAEGYASWPGYQEAWRP